MADQFGPYQPARFDESGILTIPITKSAPTNPADWFKSQYWPIVALVSAGLVLAVLVKPGKGK